MTIEKDKYRQAVSDAWRILGQLGLLDTIFNHISAAIGDSKKGFDIIMNPAGRFPSEINPKQLCVFPLKEYMPLDANHLGVIPDGLHLHSVMHSCRNRIGAIIHTHSPYSIAVGCSENGLLALSQTAIEFVGDIQMIDYGGMFRAQKMTKQLKDLAKKGGVALLRHHGTLVVADTIPEAFYLAYYIEEACKIQVLALSQKVKLVLPDEHFIKDAQQMLKKDRKDIAVQLFDAFCRQLEIKNGNN